MLTTYALVLAIVLGPEENAPVHEYVLDHGLTAEDCHSRLAGVEWSLHDDAVGFRCEPEEVR